MASIVLGVSASIAAYKSADLASRLVKAGYDVYPIMTPDATRILGPATLHALTGHPCPTGVFDEPYADNVAHIHLATVADILVIAPATMDVMARIAGGQTNDMLTAVAAATLAPILMAPGMNTGMWNSAANQRNLSLLRSAGVHFVDPIIGRLACNTIGVGKMAEPETIVEEIEALLARKKDLEGKRILITAGPTREPIDAVRYISNRSSGKMGYAIARDAARRGAKVTLISGPVALESPAQAEIVHVVTADQMHREVLARFDEADVVIASAAVADYAPDAPQDRKTKKGDAPLILSLAPTKDILADLGRRKRSRILVGFAAETDDVLDNAAKKLSTKNLDWIVANDVTAEGAGFDTDTNIVTILGRDGSRTDLPLLPKAEVATRILNIIAEQLARK
ncbi:MAG: bifunctional phosphopantothenoylcysteine decarboxylase/phosphopantothenate--cysteine ligase CoaBC [Capsulimonadaceae bacterium]|nr:bifunctional phosphopantothenoylcysteine decarboxylase/phosphopantothenate--cysteine ligase CoaBC [Capsulimonadaceae bacterium]